MKKIFSLILFVFIAHLFGCTSNEPDPVGPLTVHFDNSVGFDDLELSTPNTPYANIHDEPYKVTSLRYYISNISLKRVDGVVYTDPVKPDGSDGYFLIDESDEESQEITMSTLPEGDYTEITFTLGVDAAAMDAPTHTGALDPSHGMFWDTSSGYIFLSLEGESPVSTEPNNHFEYHIGGYKNDAASGQVNNIKTITLSFNGDIAPVRANHLPEIHLILDVAKLLNGAGEQVTFTTNAVRDTPESCEGLAENIESAFVVDHIHAN